MATEKAGPKGSDAENGPPTSPADLRLDKQALVTRADHVVPPALKADERQYGEGRLIRFTEDDDIRRVCALTWWAMVFPEDYESRFESFVRDMLPHILDIQQRRYDELVNLPVQWVMALLKGRSHHELVHDVHLKTRQGVTAGALLVAFRMCSEIGRPLLLNGAIEMLVRANEINRQRRTMDAKPYGNKAEIHSAWMAMRNVAPLWSAALVIDERVVNGGLSRMPERLLEIHGIASAFAEWGASVTSGRGTGRSPLLSADSLWRLPTFVRKMDLPVFTEDWVTAWLAETIPRTIKPER